MGFSLKGKQGPISEINVTPFVDVVLVLLVIFMITAPLMFNGINLDLPKTREVAPINLTGQQVILSLGQEGKLYLGNDEIPQEKLIFHIKEEFKRSKTQRLFLRADFRVSYGRVAKVMSFLKSNGVTDLALVTEIENGK
jgi:biopolymer transport protein TolR